MGIVSGNVFPFFAKSTYDYLCGIPLSAIDLSIGEVPNYEARMLLEKVQLAVLCGFFCID